MFERCIDKQPAMNALSLEKSTPTSLERLKFFTMISDLSLSLFW